MHDFLSVRIAGIHGMQAHEGSDWRQASKGLLAREPITAIYLLSLCSGEQYWQVVSRICVSDGEYGTVHRFR